jgi:hypothetical protein
MATRELTTSERVGQALDSYKKDHPGTAFNAQEVKDLIDGTEATETRIGRKVTSQEIKDLAIPPMIEDRNSTSKVVGVIKDTVVPAGYALDGGMNAGAGKAAAAVAAEVGSMGAKKVATALLGPIIGAGLVMVDAGIDAYHGEYKQAGISAASGLASIGAAAATGALMGSVVPGAGNVAGFIVGAAVGTVALLGSKWGLSKIFNDSAKDETPAPAPVAVRNFVPQTKVIIPGFGATAS